MSIESHTSLSCQLLVVPDCGLLTWYEECICIMLDVLNGACVTLYFASMSKRLFISSVV